MFLFSAAGGPSAQRGGRGGTDREIKNLAPADDGDLGTIDAEDCRLPEWATSWHDYGIQCLNADGGPVLDWEAVAGIGQALDSLAGREKAGEFIRQGEGATLPRLPSFFRANALQRLALSINFEALLDAWERERAAEAKGGLAENEDEYPIQSRLKIFGTAGVGKSFVVKVRFSAAPRPRLGRASAAPRPTWDGAPLW